MAQARLSPTLWGLFKETLARFLRGSLASLLKRPTKGLLPCTVAFPIPPGGGWERIRAAEQKPTRSRLGEVFLESLPGKAWAHSPQRPQLIGQGLWKPRKLWAGFQCVFAISRKTPHLGCPRKQRWRERAAGSEN